MYKKRYTRVDIDSILASLKSKYRLSQEVMMQVEMDLCSGMMKEDVMKYCTKPISVGRMKVISECIRNGFDDEVIEKLSAEERSDEIMEVVFELLDKGVNISTFEDKLESKDRLLDILNEYREQMPGPVETEDGDVVEEKEASKDSEVVTEDETSKDEAKKEKDSSPKEENKLFTSEAKNTEKPSDIEESDEEKTENESEKGSENLKDMFTTFRDEIMAGVSSAIDKSSSAEALLLKEYSEKLLKAEEKLKEKDEKIAELEKLKEQLERVEYIDVSTYEKLKQDIKNMEVQMHKNDHILEVWMHDNEERLNRAVTEIKKETEKQMESNKKGINQRGDENDMNSEINSDSDYGNSAKDETLDLTEKNVQQNTMEGRTLEVTDSNGKVISSLPVEHTNKKTSALCGIAAALGMKKRSRRSMMQMAISGELSKEQLIQIVNAIKCGLSETQLCNLIENKVPAERMPQIIEIAKLENEMGYNG